MDFSNNNGNPPNSESRELSRAIHRNGDSRPTVISVPRTPNNVRKDPPATGVGSKAIFGSLRRKWPIAIVFGLLLAPLLAAAGWFLMKPDHPATAYLLVDSDNSPLAFRTADQAVGGVVAFKVYKNTQRQLVLSPLVLNSALASESVRGLKEVSENGDPLQWLKSELKVTFPDDSEVMAVELSSENPTASKSIVDAVVDAYLNEAVLSERNDRVRRLESLEKAYAEAEGKVRSKRAELRQLADTLGTSDSQSLTLSQQTALQQFGLLQTEINTVSFDLMKAEGILESTRQQIALAKETATKNGEEQDPDVKKPTVVQPTELDLEQAMAKDYEFQQLATEVRSLMKKLKDMDRKGLGSRFTDSFKKELADNREALLERRDSIKRMVAADLQSRADSGELRRDGTGRVRMIGIDPQLEIKQVLDVEILKKRKAKIDEDLQRFEEEAKKLGRSSIDVEMMKAEISSVDEVLTRLAGEIEHTRIELKSGSRVSLISKASLISGTDIKKRLAATVGGALAGLFLPLALFVLYDMRRNLLDDPDQLSTDLKVDLLGTVPQSRIPISQMATPNSKSSRESLEHLIESVNSIVGMLVKKAKLDERQVIMVTSSAPMEGKSTLAQNLWAGLCEAKYKCILIDMDLRRPSIHRHLKSEIGLGTSDVLAGQATIAEAKRIDAQEKHFMTAGSNRRLSLASTVSDTLPKMFEDLRAEYDFIIVDSPPVLPVVDARILGEHVDGVILSTIRDKSTKLQTGACIETLRKHGTEILGIVLNGYGVGTYGYLYQSD
jgi:polysaccharide biosynthesis transport protein